MTNQEASKMLEYIKHIGNGESEYKNDAQAIAIEMAIKALSQEPSGDLISRQAVNTLVDELARAISDERCCMSRGRSTATIMQDILDLPSVNLQEPKTGHWIKENPPMVERYPFCSECGFVNPFENTLNYCPNCGAKMVEQERSDKE